MNQEENSMKYRSTRSFVTATPAEAILAGIAPDGGLYLPEKFSFPEFSWKDTVKKDFYGIATDVLFALFPEFSREEVALMVKNAYEGKFETEDLTPTVPVGEDYVLELFRGPTCAFKDVALSILPHLLVESRKKKGVSDEIVILTATSGDTGKAALQGFQDVEGTKILVFYPHGGVSRVQRAQMVTQRGENTFVSAIEGNFDDAQTGVKNIFNTFVILYPKITRSYARACHSGNFSYVIFVCFPYFRSRKFSVKRKFCSIIFFHILKYDIKIL